ncbi:MAG: hypothetical protein ACRC7C_17440, partial [Beijerinckiaceae bacterium]
MECEHFSCDPSNNGNQQRKGRQARHDIWADCCGILSLRLADATSSTTYANDGRGWQAAAVRLSRLRAYRQGISTAMSGNDSSMILTLVFLGLAVFVIMKLR